MRLPRHQSRLLQHDDAADDDAANDTADDNAANATADDDAADDTADCDDDDCGERPESARKTNPDDDNDATSDCGERRESTQTGAKVSLTLLVAKDSLGKAAFAHVGLQKGVDPAHYSVDALIKDIAWLGYTRSSLRSDNELAILQLFKHALTEARLQIETLEQLHEEHHCETFPHPARFALVHLRSDLSACTQPISFSVSLSLSLSLFLCSSNSLSPHRCTI